VRRAQRLVGAACLVLTSAAGAQGVSTAGIRGRVSADGRNGVEARVRVSDDATGFAVEVHTRGNQFLVQGLEPGARYTVSDRDRRSDIYVMNANGSDQTRLTTGGAHPAWSPDGTMLAYTGTDCAFYDDCYPTIFISSAAAPTGAANFGPGERPSWSPDGRKIAFSGLECDFYYTSCVPTVVRIGRLDQGEVTGLVRGSSPAWRP
jgi:Tol biopolymer transport system component